MMTILEQRNKAISNFVIDQLQRNYGIMTDSKLKEIEAHAKKRMPEGDDAIATPEHRLAKDCLSLIEELKSKKKDKAYSSKT